MSTQLKKEFSPEDLQRARNIITGQNGNRTKVQSVYEKKQIEHKEGDVWEENGKKWTIKDGLKQTVTKQDKLRELVKMPLVCPECNKPMKADEKNKKMWKIHNKCFQCVIYYETSLRPGSEEKFFKYSRDLMNQNKNTHMDELDQAIDAWANEKEETFISEDGHMENWVGGSVDPEVIKKLKNHIKKSKETTL